MNHEFMEALDELEKDRGIDKEILIDTIEQALLTAYKKLQGYYATNIVYCHI